MAMEKVTYTVEDSVAVITLADGENRFNPEFLSAFLGVLDAVEQQTNARTVIVISAHEKIFCNGIDLEWLAPVLQQGDKESAVHFFFQLNQLFKRLLTYPLSAIAAINGHAFAGGAILSCAFDFRFMRTQRGYFCLPEVDLGIPFLPGMNAILRKAIPFPHLIEMQLTGARLTAETCAERGIIQQACDVEVLLRQAMQFAKANGKKRAVVAELKKRLYKSIVYAIDVEDKEYIESGVYHIPG